MKTSVPESREALVLVFGTVFAGMASAGLSFAAAGPHTAARPLGILPPVWPAEWVFWAVWLVIYPCWGYATALVLRRRRVADVRGAIAMYAYGILGAFFFLPISSLTQNNPAVLALMDMHGLVGAYLLAWLYTRYEPKTLPWLSPYLIWMPLTTALKGWLWMLNR